eukprot:scaffold1559_cov193-Alexandrium_tamarense.AAC.29
MNNTTDVNPSAAAKKIRRCLCITLRDDGTSSTMFVDIFFCCMVPREESCCTTSEVVFTAGRRRRSVKWDE